MPRSQARSLSSSPTCVMRGLAVMIDRMSHTARADSSSTISSNAPAARPRRRSRAVICSTASATSDADATRGSTIPQMPGHTDASRSAWRRAAFTRTNTSAPPWPARAMASLTSPRASALRVSTTPSSRSSVMASASLRKAWLTRAASVIGANRLERRTRMAIRSLPASCRRRRRRLGHRRPGTEDRFRLFPVALRAERGPLQGVTGAGGFVAIDHPAVDHDPRVAGSRQLPMPFENRPGVLHLFRGRREAPVLRLHYGGIEPTAEPESTLAGGLGFTEGAARVTDAARRVGHEGRRPNLQAQGPGRQLQLSLAIGELLEADEHLYAEVTGHVVAGPAAKLLDARARRSNVVCGGDACRRFDVGADLDRARADAPLALETRDDDVEETDLFGRFGLGIVHLAESGPHDGVQVGVHVVVIDAGEGLGSTLPDNRDGVLDEASGMGLQVLGHRIFQVEIDEITPAAPGVVDEAARDHGHGQPGSVHLMRGHGCSPGEVTVGPVAGARPSRPFPDRAPRMPPRDRGTPGPAWPPLDRRDGRPAQRRRRPGRRRRDAPSPAAGRPPLRRRPA